MSGGPSRSGVSVRPATLDDAPLLARLHLRGWQETYSDLADAAELAAMDVSERLQEWESRLPALLADGVVVVADVDGSAVGFAAAGPVAGELPGWEVHQIFVLEAAQGAGVGGLLWSAALEPSPPGAAFLWVLAGNARARTFYERRGWRPDGATGKWLLGSRLVPEMRYRRP